MSGISNFSGPSGSAKIASCLPCRRSKLKCAREPSNPHICKRCSLNTSLECITPEFRLGRRKGSKNKTKTENAYDQQSASNNLSDDSQPEQSSSVQEVIQGNRFKRSRISTPEPAIIPSSHGKSSAASPDPFGTHEPPTTGIKVNLSPAIPETRPLSAVSSNAYDSNGNRRINHRVRGAENPLGLLASVSESVKRSPLQSSPENPQFSTTPQSQITQNNNEQPLPSFFGSSPFLLDAADDADPLSLGLVTTEEASLLLQTFHTRLSHTRWGLDPKLYTLNFTRHRSSLLFTSILAGASKFVQGYAAVSRRLTLHLEKLIHRVLTSRFKSVEIIMGLLVAIPWMSPSRHMSEDPTTQYVAEAMTMGLDLGLDKIILHQDGPGEQPESVRELPASESISPRRALAIDGYNDVDPASEFGRRLLRSRERVWIALWVLDRGVGLARGRLTMVPVTASIKNCLEWYKSPDADPQDASLVGAAALRLGLDELIAKVKSVFAEGRVDEPGSHKSSSIGEIIEGYFTDWHMHWDPIIQIGGKLPPYVDILVQHTKLSVHGAVVNHVASTPEVNRYLCTSGLTSALNVMRAFVQGHNKLKSAPNNLAVMVSFAVCFALALLVGPARLESWIEPGLLTLIRQTLRCLENIGSYPPHRHGVSAVYAKHLGEYLTQIEENIDGMGNDNTGGTSSIANAYSRKRRGNSAQLPNGHRTKRTTAAESPKISFSPLELPQNWGEDPEAANMTMSTASQAQAHPTSTSSEPVAAPMFNPDMLIPASCQSQNHEKHLGEVSSAPAPLSTMTDIEIENTVNQLDLRYDLGLLANTGMEWLDWLGGVPINENTVAW